QTIVVKERIRNYSGREDRYRNRTVTGKPDVCVEYGDGSVRYIKQGQTFSRWLFWSAITASALNLVLLQGLVGASVGKLLLGLRVVRKDGSRLPWGATLWRWVLLAVDSMCCFMPGARLVFKNPGHRRLGDLGTHSFVVKQSAAGQPIQVPGVD
ncbi:MAG: RDD family protein, partial [Aquihabitans sp.]